MTNERRRQRQVFAAEFKLEAIRHLRNRSKYLISKGTAWILGLMMNGIFANLMMMLPIPLFAVLAVYALGKLGLWGHSFQPHHTDGATPVGIIFSADGSKNDGVIGRRRSFCNHIGSAGFIPRQLMF